MDTSTDNYKSDDIRTEPFPGMFKPFRDIVRRLIGFFTLTEEERVKAGIHIGGEGRDNQEDGFQHER